MRIGFVTGLLGWGGAERQLVLLAQGLAERGDRVSVACLSEIVEPYGPLLAETGLPPEILARSGSWDPRRLLALRRWMRVQRHEALCAFGEFAAAYAHFARPRGRLRPHLIIMLRRSAASLPRLKRALIRHVLNRAELVCANSEAGRDYARRMFGLDPERIALLPNALPPEMAHAAAARGEARRELGLPDSRPVILYVGRDSPAKDIPTLCRTLARLVSRRPEVTILVAGQNLDRPPADVGCPGGGVRWLGIRRDVPRLMAAADLLLLTSRSEGTPNVVLEALAVGRPVVATAVGDLPGLLEEGPCGLLAPVGEADALAAAVERLLDDTETAAAMGRRGRGLVERRFGAAAAVTGFQGLVKEVLRDGLRERVLSRREGRP